MPLTIGVHDAESAGDPSPVITGITYRQHAEIGERLGRGLESEASVAYWEDFVAEKPLRRSQIGSAIFLSATPWVSGVFKTLEFGFIFLCTSCINYPPPLSPRLRSKVRFVLA